MSAVEDFTKILDELKALKTGISGARIKKLTQIAVEHVEVDSQLVDAIFDNLKTTKDSHKLGALYVIDSVARAYKDHANKLGEPITRSAPEGTFAHGLVKFSTVIDEACELTVNASTDEQKEKVSKLLDIWKKINVFDKEQVDAIKSKLFGIPAASATPVPAAATQTDPNELLKNLANLTGNGASPQGDPQGAPQASQPPAPGIDPNVQPPAPGVDPNAQQAALFQMLQQLQSTGQLPQMPQPPQQQPYDQQQSYNQQPSHQDNRGRRPPIGLSQEEAFRSARGGTPGGVSSTPGGRDFRERDNGFSRRGNRNRSRSPRNRRDLPPPGHVVGEKNVPGTPHYREKFVSFESTIPQDSIKVLSRTLFIGGVPNYMDDQQLSAILRPYAEVQSVILNSERKHAFVKVYSRKEAEAVISSFNKDGQFNLRTRWGVGFGPRECCDYQHGISIIPLGRLTDADRRWINAAEWGGIGLEKQLVPGLVMEEPDIEIGEGVSSKAISQKMPTDGSRNGPRSTKPGEPDDAYTDPLNQASLPSFMQSGTKANPLANLFGGSGAGQPPVAASQAVPAPPPVATAAPAGDANAQLSNLMAFLQQQQQK